MKRLAEGVTWWPKWLVIRELCCLVFLADVGCGGRTGLCFGGVGGGIWEILWILRTTESIAIVPTVRTDTLVFAPAAGLDACRTWLLVLID